MRNPASSVNGAEKKLQKTRGIKGAKVSEATRIQFAQILEQFRISDAKVYYFEENLTNKERAAVHVLCMKMGLRSKSYGRGKQRRVSVYKTKKGEPVKGKETLVCERKKKETLVCERKKKETLVSFRFSEEAKTVLQHLFSQFPPEDVEMTENKVGECSAKDDPVRANMDNMFHKPVMTKLDIVNKVKSLVTKIKESPDLRQIMENRTKLPIASFRDSITSTTESQQVVLICGETGCGKTTQVPQFLLDHAWGKGETCKIICTQPRRISATSVAERIASERGETVGDSVGYKIRLESKGGRHSSVVFCTNGILLKVLISKASGEVKKRKSSKKKSNSISDITHIIVDEIHERDCHSDFMLAIIRDMLPSYPHLRLILMSATIDAERFSKYFGGCPVIQVPGFTYPVKSYYLEDVLSIVKSPEDSHLISVKADEIMEDSSLTEQRRVALDEAIELALSNDEFDPLLQLISSDEDEKVINYQHSKTGVTPLMVFAGKGRVGDARMLLSLGADCNLRSSERKAAVDYAKQNNQGEAAEIIKKHMEKSSQYYEEEQQLMDKYISSVDPELIDCVLIEQLLRKICGDSQDGAILVFLPGWDDINRTRETLLANPIFKDPSRFVIISLHSMVPLEEQRKVFKRMPPGCRKIVLSTNIAETSVTIDDVVYVIDSGRMKEKSYDPYNNVSTLHSSWISKANVKQREGRAGRCQPGICYHLFSRTRAASLPDFQVPEIKRMPIEELCLQVKLIDPSCQIEVFLQKTMDPPIYETIRNAILVLQDIGALSSEEKLTDLGKKLGSLPVHPLISKMLFLAILLKCLDPALTLACASDYRDPFILPMVPEERKRAQAARLELASFYGGNGDQLALIAAFDCWKMAKERNEELRFCNQYFVSRGTMRMLAAMREQLKTELRRNGFIPKDASCCSLNARSPGILHAVVVAGMYPNVGRVIPHGKRTIIETADGNKVQLRTHSTNANLSHSRNITSQPLIIFDEVTHGDAGLHIRNCSVIGYLPLLLLARDIAIAPASQNDNVDGGSKSKDTDDSGDCLMSSPVNTVKVVIDRWLPFQSTALDVAQLYCLRERLSAAILHTVSQPKKILAEHLDAALHAVGCILALDGMSGISLPAKPVASLTTTTMASDGGTGSQPPQSSYLKSLLVYPARHHNRRQRATPVKQVSVAAATVNLNQQQNIAPETTTATPSANLSNAAQHAVGSILALDGMSGISLPAKPVASLTTTTTIIASDGGTGNQPPQSSYLKSPLVYPANHQRQRSIPVKQVSVAAATVNLNEQQNVAPETPSAKLSKAKRRRLRRKR